MDQPEFPSQRRSRLLQRRNRDVNVATMWIKLVVGGVGLLACIGYFLLGNHRPGSGAGAVTFLSLIPLVILAMGLLDLFLLSLSKLADDGMRRHDRHGRSNRWHLIVLTLGGFLLLHLLMLFEFGSGYLAAALTRGPNGYGIAPLIYVLGPYTAFAGLMLYYWLRPEPTPAVLTDEERVRLAADRRRALRTRLAIVAGFAVTVLIAAGLVSVMA